jgi:hypothetical protein
MDAPTDWRNGRARGKGWLTMNSDIIPELTELPSDKLQPIASQVLGEDAMPVGDLLVQRIGRSSGRATVGIFRVTGTAKVAGGDETWSAVVKVLGIPDRQSPDTDHDALQEVEVYCSRAFAELCGGVRAPACYAIHQQDSVQLLWLEDLSGALQPPWIQAQFVVAARRFVTPVTALDIMDTQCQDRPVITEPSQEARRAGRCRTSIG